MNEKTLYVCPRCKSWYSGTGYSKRECDNCKTELIPVDTDYATYSALNETEKNAFKEEYLRTHSFSDAQRNARSEVSSTWISALETISSLSLFGFVLIGLILLTFFASQRQSFAGFVAFVIAILIGIASNAFTMAFAGIAKDIKAIRRSVEEIERD